jgi:hypothetical protein
LAAIPTGEISPVAAVDRAKVVLELGERRAPVAQLDGGECGLVCFRNGGAARADAPDGAASGLLRGP